MRHGTPSAYSYHKCRCDVCKTGQREYMRRYRQSKLVTQVAVPKPVYARAVALLIERHTAEFQRFVDDETARELTA